MDEPPDRLVGFALGTLHVALFVTALVLALLAGGASPLGELGTWPGVLAYAWLWAVGTWTTWEAVSPHLRGLFALGPFLFAAFAWGAATGVTFLFGVLLAVALAEPSLALLLVLAYGGMVAAVLGALVGLLAGLLDAALLGLARRAAR